MCFFLRILESLSSLPRQHSAAIGFTKNYQPIGVTVHSHCLESSEGLVQRCRRGRGCIELWKITQFFLNTLYLNLQVFHSPCRNKQQLLLARTLKFQSIIWQQSFYIDLSSSLRAKRLGRFPSASVWLLIWIFSV